MIDDVVPMTIETDLLEENKELRIKIESLTRNCQGLASINEQLRVALLAEKKRANDAEKKLQAMRADLLKSIG